MLMEKFVFASRLDLRRDVRGQHVDTHLLACD